MEQELPISTTISASHTVPDIATDVSRFVKEAIKLVFHSKQLFLRVFVFIFFIPFFLLVLIHSLVAGPLLQKVEDSYGSSSLNQKDLQALVAIEVPFFGAFCIVWVLGTVVTISAASSAYHGQSLSLKDLIIWIKSNYRKIMNVGFYVALLGVVFLVLLLVSGRVKALLGDNGTVLAFTWIIIGVAAVLYPYLASICALGLVIVVLEDDCHRAQVLEEALRLLKDRKLQACILMLILTILSIPICIMLYITSTDDDGIPFLIGCTFMFVSSSLFCFTIFFTFLVFTVFYSECKVQSHGEKVEMQLGPKYCLVPLI